jgi:molecular chaperone GrpE
MSKEGRIEKIEYVPEQEADSEGADKKIKKVKERLKKTEQERTEYLAGLQRARADYINLERRMVKEKEEWIQFANLDFVLSILPTLDSFDEALKHFKNDSDSSETAEQDGIEQIYNQLKATLKSKGLEEIEAVGEKFNPEFHESIEVVEGEGEPDQIIEEVQKGYTLHGKVIRPSKVKVGQPRLDETGRV